MPEAATASTPPQPLKGLRKPEGAELARRLCASADVVAENFKPGTMAKYGLDYASLAQCNPRLIYASCKGFLPGPYDHRTALDEVARTAPGAQRRRTGSPHGTGRPALRADPPSRRPVR